MKITFNTRCYTFWGQNLFLEICGETVAMHYTNDSVWACEYDLNSSKSTDYRYFVLNPDGSKIFESDIKRTLPAVVTDVLVRDGFQYKSTSHVFHSTPFVEALCTHKTSKIPTLKSGQSLFVIDVPAVENGQQVGMIGSTEAFGNWQTDGILKLTPATNTIWFAVVDNSLLQTDFEYKCVVFDPKTNEILRWELGENRHFEPAEKSVIISGEMWQQFSWRGAGVAVPIFSLRSENDWGVGEFYDLRAMVDWAKLTQQKFIQILPINDTTNSKTDADSYPYSAISVYALHPMYLNMNALGEIKSKAKLQIFEQRRRELNEKSFVDYANVNALKWEYIKLIFDQEGEKTLVSADFKRFFKQNAEWLTPYAVFCVLRDLHQTCNFREWGEMATFDVKKTKKLAEKHKNEVELYYFVQYHLAKQLTEMRDYAHQNGVVLKGDLPIGISPNSLDAWMYPHLFHLDKQAGAPPDDFSVKGQNWGFPTYNWQEMERDDFHWWKSRFQNMANFFDAYRIDHILGFFRIWEIPQTAIWGLLGYFNPAMPMCRAEIENYGLFLNDERMLEPYISEQLLHRLFGSQADAIVTEFLQIKSDGTYRFLPEFATQKALLTAFEQKKRVKTESETLEKLLSLQTEVLFVEDAYRRGNFHPRITVQKSHSYAMLSPNERQIMDRIYDEFYYRRHTEFWRIQAMHKLPALLSTTNMLVCGEDLGMVPACVPQVMSDLQILSLEIQRMPKDINIEFVDPACTPYLSVSSTGTHDTSPLRSWWHENREATQRYYNSVLNLEGNAPETCTPDLAKTIVESQLAGNAMLVILPLQDYLATNETLRFADADGERINDPGNPHHFWCYRMHLNISELVEADSFNDELAEMIVKHNR